MQQVVRHLTKSALWGLLSICFGTPLAAQAEEPLVRVPALEFIDSSGYVYTVGEPFKINVDYSPLQARGDLDKLRARVFRGTYESLSKDVEKRLVGNCVAYYSTVFKPTEYNGGIDFGINFDEQWLHPVGSATLREENYLLVFELDGPQGRWLELDRNSVGRYFRQGFSFTVQPDHSVRPEEARRLVSEMRGQARQVKEALLQRQASTPGAAPSPTTEPKSIRCWRLRLVRNESAILPILDPVGCSTEEKRGIRRSWFSRLAVPGRQRDNSSVPSAEGG